MSAPGTPDALVRWAAQLIRRAAGLLGVLSGYLAVSIGALVLTGDAVYAALLAGLITTGAVVGIRRRRRMWFTPAPPATPPTTQRRAQPRSDFAVAAIVSTMVAFTAGQAWALWLYREIGSTAFDHAAEARSAAPAAVLLVFTLVVAPMSEEAFFRGLLYPLVRRWIPVMAATCLSAAVFSLFHANLVQIAVSLPLALVLGLVYERTSRLWPVIGLHAGFNLASTFAPAGRYLEVASLPLALGLTVVFGVCFWLLYELVTASD